MKKESNSPFFLESVSHANLVELATVCRDDKKIGLCFGKPGIGKTLSAKRFCNWQTIEANLAAKNGTPPLDPASMVLCDSVYYLPSITVSAARLKNELTVLKNRFEDAFLKAVNWLKPQDWASEVSKQHLKLVIVDEAFRLKYQALEQLRDIQEEWDVGLLLIADVSFRGPCHQISKALVTNYTKSVRKRCGEEFFLTDFQKSLSPASTSMWCRSLTQAIFAKAWKNGPSYEFCSANCKTTDVGSEAQTPDFRSPCHQLSEAGQGEAWRRSFLDSFSCFVFTSGVESQLERMALFARTWSANVSRCCLG